jgi:hypothetical protein
MAANDRTDRMSFWTDIPLLGTDQHSTVFVDITHILVAMLKGTAE